MSKNFKKLFQPKSLAIVGGYWADFVVEGNRKLGFKGPIWRINPNRKSDKKNKYYKNIAPLFTTKKEKVSKICGRRFLGTF